MQLQQLLARAQPRSVRQAAATVMATSLVPRLHAAPQQLAAAASGRKRLVASHALQQAGQGQQAALQQQPVVPQQQLVQQRVSRFAGLSPDDFRCAARVSVLASSCVAFLRSMLG